MKKNRLTKLAALGLLAGLSSCGNNQTDSEQNDTDPAACRGPGWENHPEKQKNTSQSMDTKRLDAIKTNRN